MTTPNERARALVWAGGFLVSVANDPKLPPAVRRRAIVIARHFPTTYEVAFAAATASVASMSLAVDSTDDVTTWGKECPDGPLRETTRLEWPEDE